MALIIRNGLIVTPTADSVRSGRGTIRVEKDRIARIAWQGEAGSIEPASGDQVIDASKRLVMPGLVDAHAHFYGMLMPGLVERLPLDMRMPYLAACFTGWEERDASLSALLGAARMMRNGTTTVMENILQGVGDSEATVKALVASGMRAVVGPMVADRPFYETVPGYRECLPATLLEEGTRPPAGPPPAEVVAACRALAKRWHGAEGRISICLSPSTPHRCTDRMLELLAEAAADDKLGVHTHLLETRPQAAAARHLYGRSMVEHIEKLGLLRPGFLGAHSVWLSDADMDRMASVGAGISHNPLSNLYLGSGIARVPQLLKRGIAVGIGSDGPNCGSSTSLIEVMKLAAIVHRLGEPEGSRWPSAEDAFRMATLGGARALGLDRDVGSLEVGKKADLVLLDAESPGFVPLNDPVMQLVFGETGSAVRSVIVNGDFIVEDGRPTKLDMAQLIGEAAERGQRLAGRVREPLSRAARFEPYLRQTYLALLREFEERS